VKTVLRMEQIKLEEDRKSQFVKPKRKPAPKFTNKPTIKQTTSAILREERLYAKKEEESMKSLELLLQGARDKTEYNQWQDNVQMEKKVAAETKKAENIIKAKITREEAILAKQREIDQKHAETEELKEEKAELMRRKAKADAKELIFIKKRIAEIAEADRNANLAKEALQEEKSRLVKVQQKEREKLMKKKERQDKAEMEKKKLMIKEIRMLEAELIENKNNNKVQLDLTTTAGHELLGEMSMMELRERLSLVKEKHKIEEEAKRNEILENKKKFEVRLQMAQEKVQIHRSQKMAEKSPNQVQPVRKSAAMIEGENRLEQMKRVLAEKQRERMQIQTASSRGASRRGTPTIL